MRLCERGEAMQKIPSSNYSVCNALDSNSPEISAKRGKSSNLMIFEISTKALNLVMAVESAALSRVQIYMQIDLAVAINLTTTSWRKKYQVMASASLQRPEISEVMIRWVALKVFVALAWWNLRQQINNKSWSSAFLPTEKSRHLVLSINPNPRLCWRIVFLHVRLSKSCCFSTFGKWDFRRAIAVIRNLCEVNLYLLFTNQNIECNFNNKMVHNHYKDKNNFARKKSWIILLHLLQKLQILSTKNKNFCLFF